MLIAIFPNNRPHHNLIRMVNFCGVVGCSNRGKRDKKSFYRLPAVIVREGKAVEELSRRRRNEWLRNINRADLKPESYRYLRICSDHFISGKPAYLHDKDNPDWVPTQNMGYKIHFPITVNTLEEQKSQHKVSKQPPASKRKVSTKQECTELENKKRNSHRFMQLFPVIHDDGVKIPENMKKMLAFSVLHSQLKAATKN